MEIIDPLSGLFMLVAASIALMLMAMVFAWFMGYIASTLFD